MQRSSSDMSVSHLDVPSTSSSLKYHFRRKPKSVSNLNTEDKISRSFSHKFKRPLCHTIIFGGQSIFNHELTLSILAPSYLLTHSQGFHGNKEPTASEPPYKVLQPYSRPNPPLSQRSKNAALSNQLQTSSSYSWNLVEDIFCIYCIVYEK